MKKTRVRIVAASAEPIVGSSSVVGADVSSLYIDMLCERFKNRGIRTVGADLSKKNASKGLVGFGDTVSAYDGKYRTMKIDGKSYMSSDDFAAYYKDLRGYKMPKFYSRDEREYKEAELLANEVQESGKLPKKALWLTIKNAVKKKIREIPSRIKREELEKFSAEWFPIDRQEDRENRKGKGMPRGVIPVLTMLTLSLLLIVCSTVMVSRASSEVSKLENKLDRLEAVRDDLATDLEVKNNLLEIQKIAVGEYGMISGDYAASRYVDVTEEEKIEVHGEKADEGSLIERILRAIGFSK